MSSIVQLKTFSYTLQLFLNPPVLPSNSRYDQFLTGLSDVDSFKLSSKIKSYLQFKANFLLFYAQNE